MILLTDTLFCEESQELADGVSDGIAARRTGVNRQSYTVECLLAGTRRGSGSSVAVDEPDAGALDPHVTGRTAVDDLDCGAALGVGKHAYLTARLERSHGPSPSGP